MRRSLLGALGAAGAVAVLVLGSTAALATPVPDNGPVSGGTTVSVPEPAGVTFTEIAAGFAHSVALGSDGNAYAWGGNWSGQLGDGTTVDSSSPVQVQVPAGVTFTEIAAGYEHSVALGSDGNAYAWGENWSGQLGNGTTVDSSSPVQVQVPAGVTFAEIAAGYWHSVALGSDGNAYAWGGNGSGQLGNGTTADSFSPVQVQVPAGVTFAEIASGYEHSVALGSDGNAYAWGGNGFGQLGNGTTADSSSPVQVPAGVTFTEIAAGGAHSVALGSDGNAYAWGNNGSGRLGNGTTVDSSIPVQVQAPAGVTFTEIAAGGAHSVALGSDGNAYAWGANGSGQLGNGTTAHSSIPVQVQAPAGVTFTEIAAGGAHSVALGSDGNAYAWGSNLWGRLGDGTATAFSDVPVQVAGVVEVTNVSFDGIAGTNLVDNGDGTWSVNAPAHPEGPVDVVVSYTWNGIAQTPVTYLNGYTYTPDPVAPTITNPLDQSVADGSTAVFSVTTTGTPTPTVSWEVSRDGGATWEEITADTAATPAADGLSVSVVGTDANNGYQYRAIATNSVGDAVSLPATLTVTPGEGTVTPGEGTDTPGEGTDTPGEGTDTPGEGTDTPGEDTEGNGTTELAFTGSTATPAVLIAALTALLLGAGLVTANRWATRRVNRQM